MKKSKDFTLLTTAAMALATVVSLSASADPRPQDATVTRDDGAYRAETDRGDRSYRNDERVTAEGRITSIDRQRDGFRVRIDRNGSSFWVPGSSVRDRADFRVGASIRFAGVFRGGMILVDAVDWPDRGGSRDDRRPDGYLDRGREMRHVRGVVERVDRRSAVAFIREAGTARLVTVDMVRIQRRDGLEFRDVNRGDRIDLSGSWDRGTFRAYRIETLHNRHW